MTARARNRVLGGTAVAAAVLAAALGALFAFTPRVTLPQPRPGQPLLQQHDEELFTDRQIGLQFEPPAYWSMQSRSVESPRDHQAERVVVKYKRLNPGYPLAWFTVRVADVEGDPSPAELLKTRKPPEEDWTVRKPVEDGLTVAGRPAARVTFGGPFDPDGKGERDFTCEVVAVRRGPRVFYFAGSYTTDDPKGQERIRRAVDSVVLDPERFVAER
jgi:hypothetical protein